MNTTCIHLRVNDLNIYMYKEEIIYKKNILKKYNKKTNTYLIDKTPYHYLTFNLTDRGPFLRRYDRSTELRLSRKYCVGRALGLSSLYKCSSKLRTTKLL
jgi:hypothetical protein